MQAVLRTTALLAGIITAGLASAQTYNFSDIITGDTPTGGPTYASMIVEDVAPDTVKFTLTPSASADADQFLSRLFLNLDDSIGALSFNQTGAFVTGVSQTTNGNQFAGTNYDVLLSFDIAPPADRLRTGRTAEWTFSAAGLSASSFFVPASGSGLYNALHIQGIPGGGSSHVTAVPEPGLLVAAGLGAAALFGRRRRKA